MLNDEEVISIKRINDCYLKLIEIVRLTYNKSDNINEMYKVFRDIYMITKYEEKLLYLLVVYIVNSKDNVIDILNYTGIINNNVVSDAFINGIKLDEINSTVLKDYLCNNGDIDIINLIESIDKEKKDKNTDVIVDNKVDYNINHLEKENVKLVEDRNKSLKRKIRRKILYDKYQGR